MATSKVKSIGQMERMELEEVEMCDVAAPFGRPPIGS